MNQNRTTAPDKMIIQLPPEPDSDGCFRAKMTGAYAVGEQIVCGVAGAIAALYQLPPNIVGGYTVTTPSATILPPPLPTTLQPMFYFTIAGHYNFQANGILENGNPWTCNWDFLISQPSGNVLPTLVGQAGYYPNPNRLSLGTAVAGAPGIQFNATMTNVTPVAGYMSFLQLASPQRTVTTEDRINISCPVNGLWLLDNPQGNNPLYSYAVNIASGATASLIPTDMPTLGIDAMRGTPLFSAGIMGESFKMYLIFQASTPNAIWIPMAMCTWNWRTNAYMTDSGWVAFGSSQQAVASPPDGLPTWNDCTNNPAYLDWNSWAA